jgi:hypothetical protein
MALAVRTPSHLIIFDMYPFSQLYSIKFHFVFFFYNLNNLRMGVLSTVQQSAALVARIMLTVKMSLDRLWSFD